MWSRVGPNRIRTLIACTTLWVVACTPTQTPDAARDRPERIISLVPAVTEILFALGAGDRVVGISDYDTYPPEALDRPRVGALIDPNLERIFELQPDLVMTYGTQSMLQERLAAAGIAEHPFESGSISHILESILEIAARIGSQEAGGRLAEEIRTALDEVAKRAGSRRPAVLLVHSRDAGTVGSFYTGGSESYFDELIQIAGGHNIFGDVDENAFQPTLEEVFLRSPEVIVELLPSERTGARGTAQRIDDWNALDSLPAVMDGRVHVLTGDHFMLVGPRLPDAARELAAAISSR